MNEHQNLEYGSWWQLTSRSYPKLSMDDHRLLSNENDRNLSN